MANTEKHSPYFNLKDAFQEKHCSICYLCRRSVTHSLDGLLYERVNDSSTVESMKASEGFCEKHFRQLVELQDATGISIITRRVLEFMVQKWIQDPKEPRKKGRAKKLCPACATWNETEESYLGLFLENLDDLDILFAHEHSFGFCIAHFRAIYSRVEDEDKRKRLLKIQMEKMESLIKELAEFERKHTYEHHHEGFGEERDSWLRAIEFLRGRSDLLSQKERRA